VRRGRGRGQSRPVHRWWCFLGFDLFWKGKKNKKKKVSSTTPTFSHWNTCTYHVFSFGSFAKKGITTDLLYFGGLVEKADTKSKKNSKMPPLKNTLLKQICISNKT